jgi:hypothetical protein
MGSFVSNRMVDPLLQNSDFNDNIDPVEIQKTLMGFLGQTYSEIAKYDSHLVSPNQFLAPKKQEFQRTAEQVIREVRGGIQPQPQQPQMFQAVPQQHPPFTPPSAVPFIDTNTAPPPPPPSDPNQMEFSFDNSVTAKTINIKLEEIEKRIKKLDTVLQKVLSYIESHDTKDPEQE